MADKIPVYNSPTETSRSDWSLLALVLGFAIGGVAFFFDSDTGTRSVARLLSDIRTNPDDKE